MSFVTKVILSVLCVVCVLTLLIGAEKHHRARVSRGETKEQVVEDWIGHPVIGVVQESGRYISTPAIVSLEFGLRSDGVVIWRRVTNNYESFSLPALTQ